jgi:Fe2+ transport system protein FeoA
VWPARCTPAMVHSGSQLPQPTLASVPRDAAVEVVALPPQDQTAQLLVHGIRPGAHLVVESDAPFGGPRVVRLGGARVAIDRRLARAILVRGLGATGTAGDLP